jgi:hypothetical protein
MRSSAPGSSEVDEPDPEHRDASDRQPLGPSIGVDHRCTTSAEEQVVRRSEPAPVTSHQRRSTASTAGSPWAASSRCIVSVRTLTASASPSSARRKNASIRLRKPRASLAGTSAADGEATDLLLTVEHHQVGVHHPVLRDRVHAPREERVGAEAAERELGHDEPRDQHDPTVRWLTVSNPRTSTRCSAHATNPTRSQTSRSHLPKRRLPTASSGATTEGTTNAPRTIARSTTAQVMARRYDVRSAAASATTPLSPEVPTERLPQPRQRTSELPSITPTRGGTGRGHGPRTPRRTLPPGCQRHTRQELAPLSRRRRRGSGGRRPLRR